MGGLYFLLPTLLVIFLSFLIVRAAAVALMMTGMDQSRARFQALSAFSGTGFTTREAESMVSHPVRRRIATWLMILGNAGIVTVIVTATSSVVTSSGYSILLTVLLLVVGVFVVVRIARNRGFTRRWERFIEDRFIRSRIIGADVVEDLTHLAEDYGLVRINITEDSPLVGGSLAQASLADRQSFVLGIERGHDWISLPGGEERVSEGDRLVVYGQLDELKRAFRGEGRKKRGWRRRSTVTG
jgi:hypothetical protein